MAQTAKRRVLLPGSEGMGRGDVGLGLAILGNFLKTLVGDLLRPEKIVCWNAGVELIAQESPVLGTLQDLEGVGVEILACKNCVEHFGLPGKLQVGENSTIPVISDLLMRSHVLTV